jgi:hypothetical protein
LKGSGADLTASGSNSSSNISSMQTSNGSNIRTSSYGDEMEVTPRGKLKVSPQLDDNSNAKDYDSTPHTMHGTANKRGGALSAMNAAFFPDDMFNDIKKNVLGTGKKLKVKQDIEMAPMGSASAAANAASGGDPRGIRTRLSLSQEASDSDSAKEGGAAGAGAGVGAGAGAGGGGWLRPLSSGDLEAHLNDA